MSERLCDITKEWLEEVGFQVTKNPDRRKSAHSTEYFLYLPRHMSVRVVYWEYRRAGHPDAVVSCMSSYSGGSIRLPGECCRSKVALCDAIEVRSKVALCDAIEVLCEVDLLDRAPKRRLSDACEGVVECGVQTPRLATIRFDDAMPNDGARVEVRVILEEPCE